MNRTGAVVVLLSVGWLPTATGAQHAPAGGVTFTATSGNVSDIGSPVKIHILRWSTDEERNPIIAALNPRPPVAAPAAAAAGSPAGAEANPSARGGLPATAGGNPPAAPGLPATAGGNPPAAPGLPAGAGASSPAAAGRGAAGRGGRGRGARGGGETPATPIAALTAAIGKAATLGYIWTNDITGYAIKYAYRVSLPDGGERILLATDRRLGAYATAWKPVSAIVTDYEFTLIEIRLNAKGSGEGKTSLTTKVIVDQEAGTIALDDYGAAPAILQNLKR